MTKVGHDGVVTVEESSTLNTELEVTEGVGFDKGFTSAYFVTDFDSQEAVLEDALVLLNREKISSLPDLLPLLEKVAESGKPLLIIAEDVEGEALSTLVVNAIRKTLKAVAVKAPFFGDRRKAFLDDLAVVTGGQVVNPDVGLLLREVGLEVLGTARRVVVSKDSTVIVDGGGSAGRHRGPQVSAARRDRGHRLRLGSREARGAAGEALRRRRGHQGRRGHRDRPQEAQGSRRGRGLRGQGGRRGGHRHRRWQRPRPGRRRCCTALRESLSGDQALGVDVFASALSSPLFWIATNAGLDGAVVVNKVSELSAGQGFNAATLTYGDLLADGVVDPVKVTRSAVLNAASVARMILTTETAIVEKPAESEDDGHGRRPPRALALGEFARSAPPATRPGARAVWGRTSLPFSCAQKLSKAIRRSYGHVRRLVIVNPWRGPLRLLSAFALLARFRRLSRASCCVTVSDGCATS